MVDTKSITYHAVIVLPPIHLSDDRFVDLYLDYHHWRKQSQHDGGCGGSGRPFVRRQVRLMGLEIAPHLALNEPIDQSSDDCQHGQRRNPLGFLKPHRRDSRRILDPPQSRLHRAILLLRGAQKLHLRTLRRASRGRQYGPSPLLFSLGACLRFDPQTIAGCFRRGLCLRRAASTDPVLTLPERLPPIV